MAKKQTIEFQLAFKADTKQAKAEIDKLQQSLTNAAATPISSGSLGLTPKLKEAQDAALKLKNALNSAVNTDTGKLNLSKFMNELNRAGVDVNKLGTQMSRLGDEGVQAFNEMTKAVAAADTKVISLGKGFQRLANTFFNTVRYQASASAIQMVTSSIRDTISFAKQLDKSLTDIQMVTGKSDEAMARYAKTATKAAKALSTTTKQYMDASLIYFQQGLSETDVKQRTDITVKLAQAVGADAETVSDWMTAIWNNFDDGSKSLEYYADVLAKLGAKTASSADEIAQGLEKFASIADTVGLSYEYAASALATVTAETRQSADVVGTAFKTIFARMEGLSLGETLDDGTTLNQYSAALAKVGVDIKDANGELKDMDDILDETSRSWGTLSKDQQVALAQSVAGVRQYSQFIALMDNYDVMQNNIKMTEEATGALENMYDEYEDSIEGMSQRATAELENLKSSLLDASQIKSFYKQLGNALEVVTSFSDALGGLPGILTIVATKLVKLYQPKISKHLQDMVYNFKDLYSQLRNGSGVSDRQLNFQESFIKQNEQFEYQKLGGMQTSKIAGSIAKAQMTLMQQGDKINDTQRQYYEWQIKILQAERDKVRQTSAAIEKKRKEVDETYDLAEAAQKAAAAEQNKHSSGIKQTGQRVQQLLPEKGLTAEATNSLTGSLFEGAQKAKWASEMTVELKQLDEQLQAAGKNAKELFGQDIETILNQITTFGEGSNRELDKLQATLQAISDTIEGGTFTPVERTEINRDFISESNKHIGEAAGATKYGVGIAASLKHPGEAITDEERATASEDMRRAFDASKDNLEFAVGEGSKDAQDAIANLNEKLNAFKDDNLADIKELIDAWKQYQAVIQAAQKQIEDESAEKAIKGTFNENQKNFNAVNAVGTPDAMNDVNDRARDMLNAVGQMGFDAESGGIKAGSTLSQAASEEENVKDVETIQEASKALKENKAAYAAAIKTVETYDKKVKEGTKLTEADKKAKEDAENSLKDLKKKMEQNIRTIQNYTKKLEQNEKLTKVDTEATEEYTAALEKEKNIFKEVAAGEQDYGAVHAENEQNIEGLKNKTDGLSDSIKNSKDKMKTMFDGLTEGASTALELYNGINILSNSFSNLGEKMADGSATWKDYLATLATAIPATLDMAKSIGQIVIVTMTKIAAYKAEKKAHGDKTKGIIKDNALEFASDATTTIGKIAGLIASVGGIPFAIAAAAVLATAGITIGFSIASGNKKANEKQAAERAETNKTVSQGLSKSLDQSKDIDNNIDKVKKLTAEGKDTSAAFKDLEEQTKNLENSLIELQSTLGEDYTLGLNIDWGELEIALANKDIDKYERLISETKQKTNKVALDAALQNYNYVANNADSTNEEKSEATQEIVKLTSQTIEDSGQLESIMDEIVANYSSKDEIYKQLKIKLGALAGVNMFSLDDATVDAIFSSTEGVSKNLAYAEMFDEANVNNISSQLSQGTSLADAKEWFYNLPEDERTLAYNIDWSGDWESQLAGMKAKLRKEVLRGEAEDLGFDGAVFEAYANSINEASGALQNYAGAAEEAALASMRTQATMNKFSRSWSSISKKLNAGGLSYVEGMQEVQKILKETYGFGVMAEDLEATTGYISQFMSGNYENYESYLHMLARGYLDTIQGETANTFAGIGAAIDNLDLDLEGSVNIDNTQALAAINQVLQTGSDEAKNQLREFLSIQGYAITANKDGTSSLTRVQDESSFKQDMEQSTAEEREKVLKELEREKDLYHEIDRELNRLEKDYDKISKRKERAFGNKRLGYIQQEIDQVKKLKAALEEGEDSQLQVAINDRDDKREKLENNEYGLKFGADGELTNYDTIRKELEDMVAASPFDDAVKQRLEDFKQYTADYEAAIDKVEDTRQQIEDYENQILDGELEKLSYATEVVNTMADMKFDYLEFQLNNLSDSVGDAAAKFAIMGKTIEENLKKGDAIQTELEGVLGLSGISMDQILGASEEQIAQLVEDKNLTADQISQLQNGLSSMYDISSAMKEQLAGVSDTILAAFEDTNKEMDKSIARLGHLTSMTEGLRNIADLVGKDALGITDDMLVKMSETQYKVAESNVQVAKAQMDQNKAALAAMEQEIAAALAVPGASEDDEAIKELREAYDSMYETVQENEQALLDVTSVALEARVKMFEDQMNSIMNTFEKSMSGAYGSFEAMQNAFSQQKELQDLYVKDYEKIYQLSKLTRDINNSIDATDNIKAKERLREIEAEIVKLQESGAQMTKYEVEELRARYDLRLAEIALEEAQNAKSQVRMQRDETGNWSYVYTADQSAIEQAMQNYENTLYNYQTKMQEYTDELQVRLISIPQQYAEAVRAIYEDQTLSDEERRARIAETQAYYQEMYSHVVSQMRVVNTDAKNLYQQDWNKYSQMTGYKISANDDWVDSFDETVASNILGIEDLEDAEDAFLDNSENMLDSLASAYDDYLSDVEESLESAGIQTETFSEDTTEYLNNVQTEAGETAAAAEDMATRHKTAFADVISGMGPLTVEYGQAVDKWNDKTNSMAIAIQTVINKYKEMTGLLGTGDGTDQSGSSKNGNKGTGSGQGANGNDGWEHYAEGGKTAEAKYQVQDTSSILGSQYVKINGAWYKAAPATGGNSWRKNDVVTLNDNAGTYKLSEDQMKIMKEVINRKGEVAEIIHDGQGKGLSIPFFAKDDFTGQYTYKPPTGNYGNVELLNLDFYNGYIYAKVKDHTNLFDHSDTNCGFVDGNTKVSTTWLPLRYLGFDGNSRSYPSYDTGGYTGEWDSSGRIAMLHQKEIVLNASDTVNFLAAVDIIRDITKTIDLQAMAQSNYLSALSAASVGTAAQVIEQQVTIHAEFPNATERSEIEAAFDTLFNRASQFANRKN